MNKVQAEPVCAAQPGARLIVMDGYGMSSVQGVIVSGVKDEDGTWDLDGRFVLLTDDGERFTVNGWCWPELTEVPPDTHKEILKINQLDSGNQMIFDTR